MPPAARISDPHECHTVTPQGAHQGGAINGPGSASVRTVFAAQARAGDACRCEGPPDFVVTGAASVLVDGRPAARRGDRTMHQPSGVITGGAASVDIGGPTRGVMLGDVLAGALACEAAAATRPDGSPRQSRGNCGLESARQIVERVTGNSIDETAFMNEAARHGETRLEGPLAHQGGSSPRSRALTLARYGIASATVAPTLENLAQAVAERRGVITSHHTSVLWNPSYRGGHAVLVTGIQYDASGAPAVVVFNDTGAGTCSSRLDAQTFVASFQPGVPFNVTRDPIW